MGFLDDIFDLGVLDLNGDGKKDSSERILSYKIMEECLKEEYGDEELSDDSDHDWNDYSLEDDFDIGDNEFPLGIHLNMELSFGKDEEVQRFIDQHSDDLIAAKYITSHGEFLYAQAIKDNFELPCSLPDESQESEMEFREIVWKIALRDVKLSLDVWAWCMEEFLPYKEYGYRCSSRMLGDVLNDFYRFPDDYLKQFTHYLSENDKFCNLVMAACEGYISGLNRVICEAISEKLFDLADALFKNELEKSKDDWKSICNIIDNMILYCSFYDDLEPMEYFRDKYIPIIKEIPEGLVHDKIWEVQPKIKKFIYEVESKNPKYAYTRRNSWRKNVSEEELALENPLYYEPEEEYKQAVHEEKYRWRTCIYGETYGLDPGNVNSKRKR